MKRSLSLRFAFLAAANASVSAHALVLSGVDAYPTVISPMPGPSVQVAITGTITASIAGEKISGNDYAPALFNNAFLSIPMTDYSWFDIAANSVETTGTYTGTLFAYEVSSSTVIGLYDRYPYPDNPEHIFRSSLGSTFDATLNGFSVGVQPVPEPATLAALTLGAFGLLRRRRTYP